jgi:hypothetical protein
MERGKSLEEEEDDYDDEDDIDLEYVPDLSMLEPLPFVLPFALITSGRHGMVQEIRSWPRYDGIVGGIHTCVRGKKA